MCGTRLNHVWMCCGCAFVCVCVCVCVCARERFEYNMGEPSERQKHHVCCYKRNDGYGFKRGCT